MDNINLIIKPKKISELILNYFKIFFKNIRLLFLFNLFNFIGFYLIIGEVVGKNFVDDFLQNYIIKTFCYALYFMFPVSFISAFYYTIIQGERPIFKNIFKTFSTNYVRILTSSLALTIAVFTLNLTLKSELMMYQYENILTFFLIEFINTIIYFFIAILTFRLHPYHTNLSKYFSRQTVKYVSTFFILMIISNLLYRYAFHLMIGLTDIVEEITAFISPDVFYSYGFIVVEYINAIAIFTVIIYIYFNLTAEQKNTFAHNEINQIKASTKDELENL